MRFFAQGSASHVSWVRALLVAVACVAAGYLLRVLIDQFIRNQVPFVTFYPAVIAASLIAGFRAGFLVVILCTPLAVWAFEGQYPIATTIIWLLMSSIVAIGCGLSRELSASLRAERDELERTKQKLELVVREQAHRAKNTFAILNALATLSAQGVSNVEEFRDRLIERIRALSSAYSLLSASQSDEPVTLKKLVEVALHPFISTYAERLGVLDGPEVRLAPSAAIPIALCLHELATNAVKYGALSLHCGRVRCSWTELSPGLFVLQWKEDGGPVVEKPKSTGFGTRLIGAALNGVPGGSATLKFEPDGVRCELSFNAV